MADTNIPTNTYNSFTNLSLGNVPDVSDPEVYRAMLDLHNALEILLTASDAAEAIFQAFIDKFRNNTAVDSDYTVLPLDGTIEVDASAGDITITMMPVADVKGWRFDIKRVDLVTTNTVLIVGSGAELIDGRADGIKVSTKSSYTVKANEAEDGWNII